MAKILAPVKRQLDTNELNTNIAKITATAIADYSKRIPDIKMYSIKELRNREQTTGR